MKLIPRLLAFAFIIHFLCAPAVGQPTVRRNGREVSVSPQLLADNIMAEVEEIRGLKFKGKLGAQHQSMNEFEDYLDRELDKELPAERAAILGKVVRKVGLHRGEEIDDVKAMVKTMMTTQAAAYYDPETEAFYVVMSDMPTVMLGSIYSHELYHGLQDQHYDLQAYILDQAGGALNDDQMIARQAVVEGEATYIMTLWSLSSMTCSIPGRDMLRPMIKMQSDMDVDSLKQMAEMSAMAGLLEGDMADSVAALDDIPPFMIETMMGAYMKGLNFIFEIDEHGWEKVAELYSNPPVSSEQILHPEKWLAGEAPVEFEWPDLEAIEGLEDWEVLDTNTLGEIQWRIVFGEHGMKSESAAAAAGWDGDSYTVLRRRGSEGSDIARDLLMLMATSWDTEADAREFAKAYGRLLRVKYPDGKGTIRISADGRDVLVVEGGSDEEANVGLGILQSLGRSRAGIGSLKL